MASIKKIPQPGWLKQQKIISSEFWSPEVQDQVIGKAGFFLRPLSLADSCLCLMSSHGYATACVHVLISYLRSSVPVGSGPIV